MHDKDHQDNENSDVEIKPRAKHFWTLSKCSCWIVREAIVITVALLIMGICFFGWKVSQGPLSLNFATPHLEKAFSDKFPSLKIKLGGTSLIWRNDTHSLNLRVYDIEMRENNTPLMMMSNADIGVSIKQLMLGKLRIRSLNFTDLAFRINKEDQGTYKLMLKETKDNKNQFSKSISINKTTAPNILDTENLDILSHLKTLSFENTNIVFNDLQNNTIWHGAYINIFIVREQEYISGSVESTLFLNKDKTLHAKLNSNINYDISEHQLNITTFFKDLNPSSLAEKLPNIPNIKTMDIGLSGEIDVSFDENFIPSKIESDIYSPEGHILIPDLYEAPLHIRDLKTNISFEKDNNKITVNEISFDFDKDSHAQIAGTASLPNEINMEGNFVIDAEATDFPTDKIEQYWPEKLAKKPRKWVTNALSKGLADKATISIAGKIIEQEESSKLKLKELTYLTGDIDFHGVTVDYLQEMPVITDAKGNASYNATEFKIHATHGKMKDMVITTGDVLISGIGTKPAINIKGHGKGSLKTALFAIDQKPLQYARKLNIDLEKTSGKVSVDLELSFPLKKDLKLTDIKFETKAELNEVNIPKFIQQYDISGGPFELTVNNKGMSILGNGKLAESPLRFNWRNNFSSKSKFMHNIKGNISLSPAMLKNFLPLPPETAKISITSLPTDFTYTRLHGKTESQLLLSADLAETEITIPAISYKKNIGNKGNISLYLHIDNQKKPIKITDLQLNLPELQAKANLTFYPKTLYIKNIDVTNVSMKNTRLSAEIRIRKDKNNIKIKGPYIDVTTFFKAAQKAKNHRKIKPFEMTIDTARLSLIKDHPIDAVKIFMRKTKWNNIDQLEIDGIAGKNDGKIYFRYIPDGKGHSLTFNADNAGASLAALGITKSIHGGKLSIAGKPVNGGGTYDITGRAILSHFTIINMPILARLLNALSPMGLQNLLSGGDGINFTTMKSNFYWQKAFVKDTQYIVSDVISFKKGKTSGASLGLTFKGKIDQTNDFLDIKGTIVPISGVNKAIGSIPIIGTILTGGTDAVFAATYSIKGPKKAVEIMVNPLATLAPGFLRKLFFE